MDNMIKPIRKQKNDDEYKTKESMRMTADVHYFNMKEKNPEKYQDKIKNNKERYHKNKKNYEDAIKMLEQYKNKESLSQSIQVN